MFDCGFTKENNWFRYRAAAIIVENDCVLLATNDKVDYYYSVGGGVQMGEKAEDAVAREVFEEAKEAGVDFTKKETFMAVIDRMNTLVDELEKLLSE